MAYIDGDNFIDGAILSFQQANRIKNNFRLATAPANIQPGMLFSDSDNDYLYHEGAAGGNRIYQYEVFHGWDDMRVPIQSLKTGGVKDPDFLQWITDIGAGRGIYAWWFGDEAVAGNEEELFFAAQLPHGYQEGENIKIHVHWTPSVNGGAGEFVKWGFEYIWLNIAGTAPANTAIIYSDASVAATATREGDASMVANKHYTTEIGTLAGAGKTISSMLVCRIFRNSSDATDDYTGSAIMLELDFHYPLDAHGSLTEWAR